MIFAQNPLGDSLDLGIFRKELGLIRGLRPAAWYEASTDVLTDGAAQFTIAQNSYLQLDTTPAAFQADQGSFTIAGWVYFDGITGFQTIVSKQFSNSSGQLDWVLASSSGSFSFTMWDTGSGSTKATGVQSFVANTWYHFAARFDATTRALDLRVGNATTLAVTDLASASLTGAPGTSTRKVRLGARDNSGGPNPLGGRLDSVSFWTRRLTDAELTTLWNSGLGQTFASLPTALSGDASLLAWWDLDERTLTRYDSKNAYNLTGYSDAIVTPSLNNGGFETAGSGPTTITNTTSTASGGPFSSWLETASGGAGTSVSVDTDVPAGGGTASCKVVVDATGLGMVAQSLTMISGAVYYVQLAAKGLTAQSLQFTDSLNATAYSTFPITTSWSTILTTFTAISTNGFGIRRAAQNVTFWLDSITITASGPTAAIGIAGTAGDGDPVKSWTDLSGNGRHLIQTSLASKPVFRSPGIGTRPALQFDGVDDRLSVLTTLATGGVSMFAVVYAPSPNTDNYVCGGLISNVGVALRLSPTDSRFMANAASAIATSSPTASGAILFGYSDGTNNYVFYNGVQGGTVGTSGYGVQSSFVVGDRSTSTATPFKGFVGEVIVFERVLTSAEQGAVLRYLSAKHGIPVS